MSAGADITDLDVRLHERFMKCSTHPSADATAVCIHCGRALCPSCATQSDSGRVVCSAACSAALLRTEQALDSLRTRYVSSLRSAGYMMLACAGVFVGFGSFEIYSGITRLAFLLFPAGLVFGITGFAYLSIARRKERRDNAARQTSRSQPRLAQPD